ncbi:uncharacterized protein METZ01_LOCUS257291, partial [marine metagenome]
MTSLIAKKWRKIAKRAMQVAFLCGD